MREKGQFFLTEDLIKTNKYIEKKSITIRETPQLTVITVMIH